MPDLSLELTRSFAAAPSQVWRCLTEPELLKQWFAPKPVTVTEIELDLRPGGRFRTVMNIPDMGEMDTGTGCVLLVEPERRLVWTSALGPGFRPNALADDPASFFMTAEMLLAPTPGGGTDYTARALHADAAAVKAHEAMGFHEGWGAAADQLGDLASSL